MKTPAFGYYMHDGPAAFSIELAGALAAEGAEKLERDWRNASAVVGKKDLIVDLSFLTEIDPGGRQLLLRLLKNGATVVANTPESRALAESILGRHSSSNCPDRTYLEAVPVGIVSSRRSSDYWIAGTADLCERLSADSSDCSTHNPSCEHAFARYIAWLQARDPFAESGPVALAIVASLPGLDKQGSLLAIREVANPSAKSTEKSASRRLGGI